MQAQESQGGVQARIIGDRVDGAANTPQGFLGFPGFKLRPHQTRPNLRILGYLRVRLLKIGKRIARPAGINQGDAQRGLGCQKLRIFHQRQPQLADPRALFPALQVGTPQIIVQGRGVIAQTQGLPEMRDGMFEVSRRKFRDAEIADVRTGGVLLDELGENPLGELEVLSF